MERVAGQVVRCVRDMGGVRHVLGSRKALEPLLLYVHETGRLRGHQELVQCRNANPL